MDTRTRLRMAARGPAVNRPVLCAAAAGTAIHNSAGLPSATGTLPTLATTTSGFGSWWTWSNTLNFVLLHFVFGDQGLRLGEAKPLVGPKGRNARAAGAWDGNATWCRN